MISDSFDTLEKDPVLVEDPNAPVVLRTTTPVCAHIDDTNTHDVLCGRGGGTNSQVGNRRFRKLVHDYQPIYLMARRKEKPIIARNIVRMIRSQGGRFLKKDDKSECLTEVGDERAEAKTSQALREGLDVRASKTATLKKEDEGQVPKRGEKLAGEMFDICKRKFLNVVLENDDDRMLFKDFEPPRAKQREECNL